MLVFVSGRSQVARNAPSAEAKHEQLPAPGPEPRGPRGAVPDCKATAGR